MCLHLCLLWEHICGAYVALEFLFCHWVLAWILMPLSHKRCYAILKDITELLELDSSIRLIEARGQQLSLNRSISRNFFTFLSSSARCRSFRVELERVPGTARRPGPEEKLVVNKPNTPDVRDRYHWKFLTSNSTSMYVLAIVCCQHIHQSWSRC